ncbi:DUF4340 domain-containing protein [Fontisphaera persica]|uniref:DUF4340 domain-containing protein n=1 Tax=Fontisphaera persica TaxID=2974023 RepID=UPI0024BFE1F8|nr:DUF4340 domain-containing protein [Fontisphaera persica]WCJ58528.1 DUF4340 domain-containing protein [Fontisphaera persica]
MNRKQLVFLVVAGLILGIAGWALYRSNQNQWKASTRTREAYLPNFPVNDVAEIRIRAGTNELVLAKAEGRWVVRQRANFPASFSEISDFLRKLADLKPGDPIEVGQSQLGRFELLDPEKGTNAATRVEFKNKDGKVLATVLLGKKYMRKSPAAGPMGGGEWPEGRYLMIAGDLGSVCLVKEVFSNVEPKPESWLDREFFKIEKVKAISFVSTNATNSWKIMRDNETAEWKMSNLSTNENLDTVKASSAASAMAFPSFSDVLEKGAKLEETGLKEPSTAILETFDGFTYTLKFGKPSADGNNYPMSFAVAFQPAQKERVPGKDEKPEDKERLDKEFKDNLKKLQDKYEKEKQFEKWDYLISKWSVEPLLKPRHEMLVVKAPEANAGATNAPPAATNP